MTEPSDASTDSFGQDAIKTRPPIDPRRTAVLVIDMIEWQVARPGMPGLPDEMAYYAERLADSVIPRTRALIDGARERGATIAYVRCGATRLDALDAVPQFREVIKLHGAFEGTQQCEVIPELAPERGDINLMKGGAGAFTSSGLDHRFRMLGIEHVLYTGVITNACVLASMTAGFDLGYYGYLVADATATAGPDVQRAAEQVVDFVLGEVVTSAAALERLGGR